VYIHDLFTEQFSGSWAAFGTTFRITGGYQKAGTSSLKRVTERILAISKGFSSKPKLHFEFSSEKESQ
jgi:hypothetical protein